jgi:hypothetical protein
MSEPVKRYYIMESAVVPMLDKQMTYTPLVNYKTDVHVVPLVMAADYERLEQECERLQEIIDSALEQFPFNADRQKFTFNGQEVTADGDDLFYSVKRVNAFLCEVHDALSVKP